MNGINAQRKRTGESTRRLDRMVQEYFDNGFTFVYDTRITSGHEDQFDHSFIEKFEARIRLEHPDQVLEKKTGYFNGIFSVYVQSHFSEKSFPLTDLEKENTKWLVDCQGVETDSHEENGRPIHMVDHYTNLNEQSVTENNSLINMVNHYTNSGTESETKRTSGQTIVEKPRVTIMKSSDKGFIMLVDMSRIDIKFKEF